MNNRYKSGADRVQIGLEPICYDDMISTENSVRAIDIIIEKMDITSLGFTYAQTAATGRKPYNPADMFKLYTYCYFNGIRSSRKIERECGRNIEIMWLIGGLAPDFKTIADFRRDNKTAIKKAFSKFSMICDSLGLIGKEIIAVDGSKFRANNSCDKYYTKKKVSKMIEYHEQNAKKYMELLDENDRLEKEHRSPEISSENLKEKLSKIEERIATLEELSASFNDTERTKESIALTDLDSKMMQASNKGYDISHNVQIAVDEKNHLVVAVDVTSNVVDKGELYNISKQAKDEMNVESITSIADKGYYSGEQFTKCLKDGISPIVPKPERHKAISREYDRENFKYDGDKDVYVCPQGKELKRCKTKKEEHHHTTYFNRKDCRVCSEKDKCTTRANGREIQDYPTKPASDIVDANTKKNLGLYKKRKTLVEHPFGTIKRTLGFTYFLTRGTENVRNESVMHFFVYNVKRVINIMKVEQLSQALR